MERRLNSSGNVVKKYRINYRPFNLKEVRLRHNAKPLHLMSFDEFWGTVKQKSV